MSHTNSKVRRFACVVMAVGGFVALHGAEARAVTLPPNFQESTPISGLTNPTVVRFSPDGRVFVAEKSGLIKVYDGLTDPTATVFADLRTNVYNFWDRGLLGMALDPNFPVQPYVYVLYAHDAAIGGTAPRWGSPGATSDPCPTPPGPTSDGCVVSGRLSRLTALGNVMSGPENVLIEDWCQQYPSHSIGDLGFGTDGALYLTGGDGASFTFTDWGQDGNPVNPCNDPLNEGGALRSQDLRTSGDPAGLDGSVLRVNPATGASLPSNPLASSGDPNVRRTIATGLRNPFRMTIRPGTNEVWTGDVGWNEREEVNRVVNPTDATVENFGWPCYEGTGRQPGYDSANLPICENLYAAGSGAVTSPYHSYRHADRVVSGESCPTGTSSIAGLDFYEGGPFPNNYDGALFFADYSRDCIWAMLPGGNGLPNPGTIQTFGAAASNPVSIQIGPSGDLFYPDFDGGTIRRIRYLPGNQPPTAVAEATPSSGPAPLNVQFDATDSSDPEDDPLTFAWDLDNDGAFDDSTSATPSRTYSQAGQHTATVRVTDSLGATDADAVTVTAGNSPPQVTITSPAPDFTWNVGESIGFAATATDGQDGNLPASAFSWQLDLEHCPGGCHTHDVQEFAGVRSGSFNAPDHEYPSQLDLSVTATDAGGLTDTDAVTLDPETVELTLASQPSGLQLVLNGSQAQAPFTNTLIRGSQNSVSAPSPQQLGPQNFLFASWSDGGAQTHQVVASSTQTLTGQFAPASTGSATVSRSGSAITYTASAGVANDVTTTLAGGVYSFAEPGIAAGAGCTQASGARVDCPGSGTTTTTVDLADGNDRLTAGPGVQGKFVINGGTGDDVLATGNKADTLNGGPGNDDLIGGGGEDKLDGGTGADLFDGGSGVDRAIYTNHSGVVVDIEPTGPATADDGNATDGPAGARDEVLTTIEWILGTALGDVLDATAAVSPTTLRGAAKPDVLTDSPFNDTLMGNGGADTINCINGGADSYTPDAADTVNGSC